MLGIEPLVPTLLYFSSKNDLNLFPLTFSCIMLKNVQAYFKNLTAFTSMFDHFSNARMKGLKAFVTLLRHWDWDTGKWFEQTFDLKPEPNAERFFGWSLFRRVCTQVMWCFDHCGVSLGYKISKITRAGTLCCCMVEKYVLVISFVTSSPRTSVIYSKGFPILNFFLSPFSHAQIWSWFWRSKS